MSFRSRIGSEAAVCLVLATALAFCGCRYGDRCYQLLESRQYESAIAACTAAIDSGRGNPDIDYGNRGIAFMRTGRFDRARADFEKAIELNPATANHYYNLACLHSLANDVDAACRSLWQAVDRGMTDREFMKHDPDLDNLRTAPCYRQIIAGSQTKL